MIKKLNAFFLKQIPYKDTSSIANFLTEESMLDALCYGVKKNNKNIGSDLSSHSKLSLTIYESKNGKLSTIKETSIIKNYKLIDRSPIATASAFYIKEIILNTALYFDTKYFILTEKTYEALEENEKINTKNKNIYIEILLRAFEIKILYIMGLIPNIKNCVICQNDKTEKWFFSPSEGGLICKNCKKHNTVNDTVTIDTNTIYFLNLIKNKTLIETVNSKDIINYKNEARFTSKKILQNLLFSHIGVKIKSTAFLEEIILKETINEEQ